MHIYEHALCMHADRQSSSVVDSRRQKDSTTSTTSTTVQLRAKGLYLAPAWPQAGFCFGKRQKPIANSRTWRFFASVPDLSDSFFLFLQNVAEIKTNPSLIVRKTDCSTGARRRSGCVPGAQGSAATEVCPLLPLEVAAVSCQAFSNRMWAVCWR